MEPTLLVLGTGMILLCTIDKSASNSHLMILMITALAICIYLQCMSGEMKPPADAAISARSTKLQDSGLTRKDSADGVQKSESPSAEKAPAQEATAKATARKNAPFHFDNLPADPREFAYTDKDLQTRRDSFVFRKTLIHPSSESRKRMLDEMYRELVDSSTKKDPALRPTDQTSDAEQCTPLRGLRVRDII